MGVATFLGRFRPAGVLYTDTETMAPKTTSRRSSQLVIWGVVLLLLIGAVYAIRSMTRERLSVSVARVTFQDLVKSSSTNGKVEPIDDFQAHAKEAGQVQEIYVNVGDKVKAGRLLLKMDDRNALSNLAHAQSSLQSAESTANDIKQGGSQDERNTYASDLNREKLRRQQDANSLAALQKLQQQGAASAGEVAAAQHRLEIDDNNIRSIEQHSTQRYGDTDKARAEAQIAEARAAVTAAQGSYASADIRTPISGTVYYLPVNQYDYVDAGVDLIYVADLTRLKVTAYFDEPEIGNLKNGQPVKIVWDARPDKVWHGHIAQAPTTIISYGTRNVGECFITVDDADGVLQPNANVTITVTTALHAHVLAVPRESLHFEGPNPYVFRVVQKKLVKTPVHIGIVNSNWAEITSGLADGDVVARSASTNRDLSDGLEVTVSNR
jgi:HlyD family secretion protein